MRAVFVSLLLTGCPSTDTLLGLEATIGEARVDVAAGVVSVEVDVDYRNGAYTEEARMFQPMLLEVYAGDAPVAQMSAQIPPDTTLTLAPGESASATFTGATDPGEASDPARLCSGATVIFRFVDGTTGDPGLVESEASVTCE